MGIKLPMAEGRSSEIISMMKWIRTSRLSMKDSLSIKLIAGGSTCASTDASESCPSIIAASKAASRGRNGSSNLKA